MVGISNPVSGIRILLFGAALAAAAIPARAEDAPRLFDPNDRGARFDLSGLVRLRFLTTLDFPPFNFADPQGRPVGFNIDIARAICAELDIEAKCEIEAMPWEELDPALDGLRGEAIIAGHRITAGLREARAVSAPYFRFPARFAARNGFVPDSTDMTRLVLGKQVAVVRGSAHAAMLRAWFPDAVAVEFDTPAETYDALASSETEYVFGDGVAMSFWLASPKADGCCRFVSGPFISDHFLGPGISIVMRKDSARMIPVIDSALLALEEKGIYEEIFTRFFPLSPFADGIGAPVSAAPEGQAESPEQSG
ncbi:transporter substrate-binding domain-containing protein [Oricola thermophila]|uniref:Transporter substrate-binding domain-containing protein n=1 Tax=Oricola thermophila TaxID=2742145 RepID=A0A6N1VK96_9HYPH|nr:transporter substrate-binding domain-containing protein [Oricola thermophila]QKV19357.1 transporter substrate-binding domain-containing protein [Oricola thermophila]